MKLFKNLPDWMTSKRVDPKEVLRSLILSKISRVRCFFNRDLQLVASWSFWNPASNFSDTAASTILMRGRTRRGIYNLKKKMKIILTIRLVSHHQRPFEFHSSSQVYLKQKTLGGVWEKTAYVPGIAIYLRANFWTSTKHKRKTRRWADKWRRAKFDKSNPTPLTGKI